MRQNNILAAAVLAVPLFLTAGAYSTAHASGYAVFTHGASSLGQGNAVTAHADDPSAVFYNPALITKLPGTQLQAGTTAIVTSRDFHSATTGADFSADTTVSFPSHFYVTSKLSDNLSAGLGVYNPFGLKSEWGDSWEGQFIATKSQLTTYNVNPTVAYRITPALSVAVGVDVMFLDAKLERKVPAAAFAPLVIPANPTLKFQGDGTGVGFNLGVAYDVTPNLTVGVSYRSEVDVDLKGNTTTSPTVAPANNGGKAELTLPQQVTAGIAYRVSEPLIVEAGLRWEGWSAFHDLTIQLENGSKVVSPRNWDDALGCNFGVKYKLNDTVSLLGGYIFGSNPIPDSTFDPTIPDSDTHIFTVGTDVDYRNFRVALAYAYQKLDERTKNNTIGTLPGAPAVTRANGDYNTDAHLIAASLVYRF